MSTATQPQEGESLVARTLRTGFPWLRFPAELEQEFVAEYRLSRRRLVRIGVCLALATIVGLAILDRALIGVDAHGVPDAIRFGVHIPLVIVAIVLSSRRLYRWYWPFVHTFAPLYGLATVVLAVHAAGALTSFIYARLIIAIFFFYFMLGLSFKAAVRTNLVTLAGFVAAAMASGMTPQFAIYLSFLLVCANLYAGAGCYALEHANRVAFLDRRLLREVATHDGLTRLLNRAALESEIHRIWQQAIRDRDVVTAVMIDIDHFKAYNDRYGHQAGDRCLRDVAQAIRRAAGSRPHDCVARYGGEEMIAILPGADRDGGEQVARAMLAEVAQLAIPHDRSLTQPHVTVSIGVASLRPTRDSSHDLIVRIADRALYLAKEQGRNRHAVLDEADLGEATVVLAARELRTAG
ncbi:MAG: diguanylate cyclase [Steroidobacteraceae bacterium]